MDLYQLDNKKFPRNIDESNELPLLVYYNKQHYFLKIDSKSVKPELNKIRRGIG